MQGLNKNILSWYAGLEQNIYYLDVQGLNKIILTTLHLCQKLSADTATPQWESLSKTYQSTKHTTDGLTGKVLQKGAQN